MPRVFLSYSSKDKTFVEQLARELDRRNIGVWLDKWEIRVGDSLIWKINEGLRSHDFLVIVLSPDAVTSSWVQRELSSALMSELNKKKVIVLPILLRDCEIPPLLSDKKYADFRTSFAEGLAELSHAFAPELFVERDRKVTGEILGVDFGTANSCMAVYQNGVPKVVLNREGKDTTPSVVALMPDGEWIAGLPALLQAESNLARTFFSMKTKLGSEFSFAHEGRTLRAYDIASRLFAKLREDAELFLGKATKKIVLTCPARFSHRQRVELGLAAKLGGFELIRLVAEPTAALLAYELHREKHVFSEQLHVAVVDLGGGSFDVSIVTPDDGVVEVHAVSGDTKLGGDDFDHLLMEHFIESFERDNCVRLKQDLRTTRRMLTEAERAKVVLSSATRTKVEVSYLPVVSGEARHLELELDVRTFEQVTQELIDRAARLCREALAEFTRSVYFADDSPIEKSSKENLLGKARNAITHVILSGLPTRMPCFREMVRNEFGRIPICKIDPDHVVALGIARQAAILEGLERDILLLDCFPLSIGVELQGGQMQTMIPKNTVIPIQKSQIFEAEEFRSKGVIVKVFEGENSLCAENELLGVFVFPPDQIGSDAREFEIAIEVDANSLIHLNVHALDTRDAATFSLNSTNLIPQSDVDLRSNLSEATSKKDSLRSRPALWKSGP
jgi:molecular chaperone DnaK